MISSEKRGIVEFFLNVFKLQMNLSGRTAQYRLVSEADAGREKIFELRIQDDDQWITRRMTIAPLGEESGSKSKCFKVIYDDMMVIKIPPAPITDFGRYVESIQAERRIAALLEPEIRCVTPSLSAVLRKVPPFCNELDTDARRFEERCHQKIEILPVFQKYLMIGDTFVFFMNLSRYSFLGQIVDEMHDIQEALFREITGQTDAIGNPMLYEALYGSDEDGVFFSLDGLYGAYEDALLQLQPRHGVSMVASYSSKEWFLAHLAGRPVIPEGSQFSPAFVDDVNALIARIMDSGASVIERFRKRMRSHVHRKRFVQHKARMGAMSTNLLAHLAVLRRKGIALRDLKPDNVFVAGDLSGDPFLLETAENFSIGLIDFETSVVFRPDGGAPVSQPMLAGTPSYSTVSHLFTNDILSRSYESLARILHLQDWYAVAGMIYNVVTGHQLSRGTGRLMPRIIQDLKAPHLKKVSRSDLMQRYSRMFWNSARHELRQKLGRQRKMLRDVRVAIPKSAKEMLAEEIGASVAAIQQRIRRLVEDPALSLSRKDIDGLSTASYATLAKWQQHWGRRAETDAGAAGREAISGLLGRLATLRWDREAMDKLIGLLAVPRPVVSADMLILVMINTVMYGMHKPEWGDVDSGAGVPASGSEAPKPPPRQA